MLPPISMPSDCEIIANAPPAPTFVLVEDGRELGRIEGYPGEDFFWGLLGKLLEKLPQNADQAATN